MRGSGILWYQNTSCSLGGSSREPQEHSLPSVCPSVPITAQGSLQPPGHRGTQLHHLTSGSRSCPFLVVNRTTVFCIFCQWSSFCIL